MGNLMSRAFKMSNDVYAAMLARGFGGEIRTFATTGCRLADWLVPGRESAAIAVAAVMAGRVLAMTDATLERALQAPPVGPGEPLFDLHDVGFVYASRQVALDGIDLTIWPGERVVLLGANGSGKSTLLKLLDGIVGPTSGTIRALGLDVAAVAAGQDAFRFHREVGLVFQDPDIQLFSATVLDDVAFGPLQLGLSQDEVRERCDEALAEMEHRPPGRSGSVRAVRRREEARRDRLGALAQAGRRAARRAHRVPGPANEVGAGRSDPAPGRGRADSDHGHPRAGHRAA